MYGGNTTAGIHSHSLAGLAEPTSCASSHSDCWARGSGTLEELDCLVAGSRGMKRNRGSFRFPPETERTIVLGKVAVRCFRFMVQDKIT